jgi:hypothetical protein
MEFHTYIEISRLHSRRHVKQILIQGLGVECNFEPQGKEISWYTGSWRQSHFGGSRFEFQSRTVLKVVLSCQILVSSDEKSIWTSALIMCTHLRFELYFPFESAWIICIECQYVSMYGMKDLQPPEWHHPAFLQFNRMRNFPHNIFFAYCLVHSV